MLHSELCHEMATVIPMVKPAHRADMHEKWVTLLKSVSGEAMLELARKRPSTGESAISEDKLKLLAGALFSQ